MDGAHSSMRFLPAVDSLQFLSDFWLYFHSAGPFCECKTAVNCSKQLKYKIGKVTYKLATEMEYLGKHDKQRMSTESEKTILI